MLPEQCKLWSCNASNGTYIIAVVARYNVSGTRVERYAASQFSASANKDSSSVNRADIHDILNKNLYKWSDVEQH